MLLPLFALLAKPPLRQALWLGALCGSVVSAARVVLDTPPTVSAWMLIAMVPGSLLARLGHELAHAAAIMRAGRNLPAIGIAYHPGKGVYCFADLSELGKQPRQVVLDVLFSGYDVNLCILAVLFLLSQWFWGSTVGGVFAVAHAFVTTGFVLALYPPSPATDLGRALRIMACEPKGAKQSHALMTIWWSSLMFVFIWSGFVFVRAQWT
jgi:hypothetical protein